MALHQAQEEGRSGLAKIADGMAHCAIGSVTMLTVSALVSGPILVGFFVNAATSISASD